MDESARRLDWSELEVPADVPPLDVVPSHAHVFMFSAVTWNRHQIHYCAEAAKAEGHEGVVVQRALLGNYLANMLSRWIGNAGELRQLEWKVRKSALPGRRLRCSGTAVRLLRAAHGRVAECELRIADDDGADIVIGKALIAERTPG